MPRDASSEDLTRLTETAREIRRDIVRMTMGPEGGDPGESLALADLVTALVFHDLNLDPTRPAWPERDRLILSGGNGAPALYSALARRGFLPIEELGTYRRIGGRLPGHVDQRRLPGIEASTGCPGQGIGMAVGIALDQRLRRGASRVVALLGEGECRAGPTWEALLAGGQYALEPLTVIVEQDRHPHGGDAEPLLGIAPILDKFRAFRYETLEIDGHDFVQILGALQRARATTGRPTAILARTVRGKGVSFLEHRSAGHGNDPAGGDAERALAELEARP